MELINRSRFVLIYLSINGIITKLFEKQIIELNLQTKIYTHKITSIDRLASFVFL